MNKPSIEIKERKKREKKKGKREWVVGVTLELLL